MPAERFGPRRSRAAMKKFLRRERRASEGKGGKRNDR
jgi:hypothetical protein